jgi:hypothetical protein
LKDDYAIDIVRENVQLTPKDEYDRDLKILMKSMKTLNKASPSRRIECLDDEEYESLNDADADRKNILEMKLYVYRRNIYGISVDNVDEASTKHMKSPRYLKTPPLPGKPRRGAAVIHCLRRVDICFKSPLDYRYASRHFGLS